jgi:hypothetical protein
MNDDFIEWINQCPNNWLRLEVEGDSVTYKFFKPSESESEAIENE